MATKPYYMNSFILQAGGGIAGIGLIVLLLLIAVSFFIYFLPAIIGRKKRNAGSILLLNIFLGWTFIGWIVALVWATSADNENRIIINNTGPATVTNSIDQLAKLASLKEKGLISEEEFQREKSKLLA
jgi:hypothetical protein